MTTGDVYWVEFPSVNGREQAGRRPVIVLQDESFASSLPLVVVVPLTGALSALRFPGSVLILPTDENGLTQPSAALVFQIRAVDRRRI